MLPFKFFNWMKQLLFIPLLALVLVESYGQKVSVASMKQNVVTLGTDNPLTIMAESCDCNNVTVYTDNGTIKRVGDCSYNYHPARLGMAQIVVGCRGRKAPVNYLMRVVGSSTEDAVLTPVVGRKSGGNMRKNDFAAQIGVGIINNSEKSIKYVIDKFELIAIRDDKVLFTMYNKGPMFNEHILRYLSSLKVGDRIVFCNMECSASKRATRYLPPMEFNIIN